MRMHCPLSKHSTGPKQHFHFPLTMGGFRKVAPYFFAALAVWTNFTKGWRELRRFVYNNGQAAENSGVLQWSANIDHSSNCSPTQLPPRETAASSNAKRWGRASVQSANRKWQAFCKHDLCPGLCDAVVSATRHPSQHSSINASFH